MPSTNQTWTSVTTAKNKLFDISLFNIWKYRDLILLTARRDLVTMHKQTVLGPLWYFIPPILTTVVFQIVFGKIAGITTNEIPPFLFFMSGVVIWFYFSTCLSKCATIFTNNSSLFTKVYFPRLTIPISQLLSSAWQFFIQFLIFLGFYLFFLWGGAPIHFSYRVIILPFLILQTALLGLGMGCWIAALTTRFRDLQMAITPMIQLWMYGSCIFYPLSSVPENLRMVLIFNPIVPIVESFRFAMMGQGTVEIWQWLISVGVTFLGLFFGLSQFSRAEKTMADTI